MTGLARIECDDALIGCNDALAYFELVVILQMILTRNCVLSMIGMVLDLKTF